MAENRDAGVDPRFDPVFQRGYDPTRHGGRAPRAAPRHVSEPVPVEAVPAEAALVEVIRDPQTDRAPTPADFTLRTRNPFRLALLIASTLSIGGACLLIWQRIEANPFYQGFSGTDLFALFRSQLTDAALVPLLTGGILGLCLWLAIGALGHRTKADE